MNKQHIGQIGLRNLHNTCYLNACLQLLTHSGFFLSNFLQQINDGNDEIFNDVEKTIQKLILEKWTSKNKTFNPTNIQKSIAKRNPIFELGPQNDSSESMVFLLDLFKNESLLNVFENKFNSTRECQNCKNITKSIETFNIISLDMAPSFDESFDIFQKTELLDGKVNCDKCNQKQDFTKTYTFNKLADNLILHMKRFIQRGNRYIKNNNPINIQDILTINGYNYELRGLIIHSGRIGGGHYYFIGKNLINQWNMYDDLSCYTTEIDIKHYEKLGYIFLYEKIKK